MFGPIFPLGITLHGLNNLSRHATHNRYTAWVHRLFARER